MPGWATSPKMPHSQRAGLIQVDVHLWQKADVHVACSQYRHHRQVATVPCRISEHLQEKANYFGRLENSDLIMYSFSTHHVRSIEKGVLPMSFTRPMAFALHVASM